MADISMLALALALLNKQSERVRTGWTAQHERFALNSHCGHGSLVFGGRTAIFDP